MLRRPVVISGICTVLLISLFLACCGPSGTGEVTANVKSVEFQAGMITLATGIGCGLTQPSTVQFDGETEFFDVTGQKVKPSALVGATSISFECVEKGKEVPAKKITITNTSDTVRSVIFPGGTITLANGKGCDSTTPPTVQFNSGTEFLGLNGQEVGSSDLASATSISFECGKGGLAKKITIKEMSEDVKYVDLQAHTITVAGGKGCGSTPPSTVQFNSDTEFLGPKGRKAKSSDLLRATTISFECDKSGLAKKISIKETSEDVKWVDFQAQTITLTGGNGCGPTTPPTVKFDSKTQFLGLNGRKVGSSALVRGTIISYECVEKSPVKKVTIKGSSDTDGPSFSLGHVVDSVVANTGQDRFSGVEGDIAFEKAVLKWHLADGLQFSSASCWVLAGDAGPNRFQCSYVDPPGCQAAELFKKVQQTMSTFQCFRVDEGRSSQSVRTYTDKDNRVRVSVTACIPSEEPRDRVEVEACTPGKNKLGRVDVKGCTLTVEVIPTPH